MYKIAYNDMIKIRIAISIKQYIKASILVNYNPEGAKVDEVRWTN